MILKQSHIFHSLPFTYPFILDDSSNQHQSAFDGEVQIHIRQQRQQQGFDHHQPTTYTMAPNNRRGKKTPHTIFGMEDGSEPEPEAEGEAEADADADAQAQAEAEAQAERDENGIAEAAEGEGMYEPELEVGVEQVQETQVEMQVQDQHVQVQEQVQEQGLLRKELQDYHDPDPEALNAEEFIPADSDAVGHDRLHTLAQHVVDAVEQGHYPTVTAAEQAVQAANDEMAAEYQRQYDERGGDYAADEQDHHHVHHHRDEDDQEHDHGHEHDGHDRNAAAEDLLSFATEQALPSEEYSQQFSSLLDHATAAAFRGQDGVGSSAQSALQDAIDAETAARAALTSSFDADDVAHALGAGGTRGGEGGVVDENGQMVFPQEASEYDQAVAAAAAAVGQENGGAGAGDMTGLEGDEANARNKSSRKRKRVKEPMAEDQIKAKKETHVSDPFFLLSFFFTVCHLWSRHCCLLLEVGPLIESQSPFINYSFASLLTERG